MEASNDPTTLTQFATPTAELRTSKSFLARLLRRDRPQTSSTPAITYSSSPRWKKVSIRVSESQDASHVSTESYISPAADFPIVNFKKRSSKNELRTFRNVLGRLMNIIEKRTSTKEGLKPYKDSDFRQSWMPDGSCKECYDCGSKFTTFLRRHHCRICGQIFCSSCCNQEVPGKIMGFEGGLRACTYCCGVFTELVKGSDSGDLGTLRDNLKAQLNDQSLNSADLRTTSAHGSFTPSRRLSMSDSFELASTRISSVFDMAPATEPMQDMTLEERQSLVKDSQQLKALFFEMLNPVDGVPLTSKRHRLRTYSDCFHGHELVTWLVKSDKAQDKHQALIIGQALLDAKYVCCLTDSNTSTFYNDYTLYEFRQVSHTEMESGQRQAKRLSQFSEITEDTPGWIRELDQTLDVSCDFQQSLLQSTSSSVVTREFRTRSKSNLLEMAVDSDSRTNVTPPLLTGSHGSHEQLATREEIHQGVAMAFSPGSVEMPTTEQQVASDQQNVIHDKFKALYRRHQYALCAQLLERSRVSHVWADMILRLSSEISQWVRADVCSNRDHMDVASYVHIKKVRSGSPSDSSVTYGVICTKSVVHKSMRSSIRDPKIMLLQSSIEYQRVANKLSSLEPQILQEQEYLQNCVTKISKYKPDVLLVEGTVTRVAQQLLLQTGITVVINVKTSVMQRVARMTDGDVIPSLDSLISPPKLGTCYKFQTELFRFKDGYYKTLMVFSGCSASLGCSVLLRGEKHADLVKVKAILMLMVRACYQERLEISFFNDLSALPPSDKPRKERSRHASAESKDSFDGAITTRSGELVKRTESSQSSPSSSTTQLSTVHTQNSKELSVFRHILSNVILDYSPFVKVSPPYFETERGKISASKLGIIAPSYYSQLLEQSGEETATSETVTQGVNELYDHRMVEGRLESLTAEIAEPHPFLKEALNFSANGKQLKDMRASYRASGGRLFIKPGPFYVQASNGENGARNTNSVGPDCFNISCHQRLSVLFSSYTLDPTPHSCIKPWVVPMEYYGRNDLTLGQFLELYCFQPTYQCPREGCETIMLDHIRKFVHGSGSLYLVVRRITQSTEDQYEEGLITTWGWCRKCKKATAVVPVAPSTWHLSFARYLQLQLNSTLTGSLISADCVHSIAKDYYQYFRCGDLVATFRHSSVTLREIMFPPPQIATKHSITKDHITSQVKIVHTHGLGLFSDVMEALHRLKSYGLDQESKNFVVEDYEKELKKEKDWFLAEIDRIHPELVGQALPTGAELNEFRASSSLDHQLYYKLDDDLIKLKCHLAHAVQNWNMRIEGLSTKEDRLGERKLRNDSVLLTRSPKAVDAPGLGDLAPMSSKDPKGAVQSTADEPTTKPEVSHERSSSHESIEDTLVSAGLEELDLAHYHNSISRGLLAGVDKPYSIRSTESVGSSVVVVGTPDLISNSSPVSTLQQAQTAERSPLAGTVSSSTDNVEQEVDKQRGRLESQSGADNSSALDQPLSPHILNTDNTDQLDQGIMFSGSFLNNTSMSGDGNSVPADAVDHSEVNGNQLNEDQTAMARADSVEDLTSSNMTVRDAWSQAESLRRQYSTSDALSTAASSKTAKRPKPIKKSGSRFLLGLESVKTAILHNTEEVIAPIENPFSVNQHYLLPSTLGVPVIIYDEEPSSIIAYALGSQDYAEQMKEYHKQMEARSAESADSSKPLPEKAQLARSDLEAVLNLTSISSLRASIKSNRSTLSTAHEQESLDRGVASEAVDLSSAAFDFGDVDQYRFGKPKELNETNSGINQHFDMQFTEKSVTGDKMALFYCKVYFAADFKKLRQLIYPDGEEQFIRVLSRCYKWNARGGKSGLGFCKTQEDRFIMKQMGRQEVQSFMEFGPQYFEYVTDTLQSTDESKSKCALAKILGVFRIGLKNFVTNAVFKQDVLIIENLFYGRRIGKVFDLKGSDRNRLARKETITDPVLLDENFLKYSKQSPIYVREHAKRLLMHALVCDSQFLAKHTVMDYSLLCGYDEETKELVIGIIDYIRTFTWDKKLETVVKSSGILGFPGKMPTVVSPEVYRTRFLEAMDRYINIVPDRWTGFTSSR